MIIFDFDKCEIINFEIAHCANGIEKIVNLQEFTIKVNYLKYYEYLNNWIKTIRESGVWASHLSLRSTVVATRTPPGPSIEVFSVSASLWASRPPTPSVAQVSIKVSICAEVMRQRAASCTSTQSCGCAPRASSAFSPPSTVSARVGPPHSTLKKEGWA